MLTELIKKEASKFGAIVRDAEDLCLHTLRQETRILYVQFLSSLTNIEQRQEARRAYWDAYSSDPMEFKKST